MLPLRGIAGLLIAGFAAAYYPAPALSQPYPAKPVHLIIPFPPGGSNDVVGRMIAAQLSTRLDKPVIVDNQGIVAPAGTPRPVLERLHKEFTAIVASAETKKRFESEGADPLQMGPEDLGRFIASETAKWARVVKEARIRAD